MGARRGTAMGTGRLLLATLGLALLLRGALAVAEIGSQAPVHPVDAADYRTLADHIGAFLSPPRRLVDLSVFHPPGYPALVWLGETVGGVAGVVALQVLLGTATVGLTFLLGRELQDDATGLVAAALVAVEPLSVLYTGLVLTETLFTTLLIAALLLLLLALRTSSWRPSAAAGATLGVAVLVRPIVVYLPVLLVPLIAIAARSPRRRLRLVAAAAFALCFAVPVGGLVARNAAVAGGPMLSSVDATNLLEYRAAAAVAAERGISRERAARDIRSELRGRLASADDEFERASVRRRHGLRLLLEHPLGTLRSSAAGAVHVLVAPGRGTLELVFPQAPRALRAATVAYTVALTLLLLAGAVLGSLLLARRRRRAALPLALTAVYLVVLSSGAEGESRFRIPLVPLLAVLAAPALVTVGRRAAEGLGEYRHGDARRVPPRGFEPRFPP